MSAADEDFDAQLAERGDDRPGLDDLDDAELDEASDDTDDDYPDDATDDEIDLVVGLYREDGKPASVSFPKDVANDFDGFVDQLRRLPADAGALGAVVIDSDFFVLVRVRGQVVQALLSSIVAANDWPIARDVADFLGEDIPEDEDEDAAVGDFDMFADARLSELDLENITADLDADPVDLVADVAKRLGFADVFKKAAASFDL